MEAFHLLLAHFGNSGMRRSLADSLNLTGTARYNHDIRYKLRLVNLSAEEQLLRKRVPASWETEVPFYNHSELHWINKMATTAGIDALLLPFQNLETLPEDNGERFFSCYLSWLRQVKPRRDDNEMCLCVKCGPADPLPSSSDAPLPLPATAPTEETNNNPQVSPPVPAAATTAPAPAPIPPPPVPPMPQLQPIAPQIQPAPIIPFQYQVPLTPLFWCQTWAANNVLQQNWCCDQYRNYWLHTNRRGRPPHDRSCRNKKK